MTYQRNETPEPLASGSEVERLGRENARLQDLLDRRPAMNAGLIEAYVEWSNLCYASDAAVAGRDESVLQ